MRGDRAVIIFRLMFGLLFISLVAIFPAHARDAAVSLPVDSPPKKYDYPFKGEIAIYYDLDPDDGMWGWTDVSEVKRGICRIHLVPQGTVAYGAVLDEYAKTRLLRH